MGIFGYSDDNLLVAPSLDSLQEMLKTCELFAASSVKVQVLGYIFDWDPGIRKMCNI